MSGMEQNYQSPDYNGWVSLGVSEDETRYL